MRLYHGAVAPEPLRKCREAAPSHVHGACWTPTKMTPHEYPYFVDNGAFTGDFDPGEWLRLLDTIDDRMPNPPDFVVLPDEFNDAEGTVEKHRVWASEVLDRGFRPAFVMQPGMPVTQQVALADGLGAHVVFVGGECRWQQAHLAEIVEACEDHGIQAHLGNPGGEDELVRAYHVGFTSADTSTIVRNGNYHWLEALEDAALSRGAPIKGGRQSDLSEAMQ